MAYKRIKDESKLIAKWNLEASKPHYFHVFLWKDQENFDSNTKDNNPGESSGCVNFAPRIVEVTETSEREIIRPKLGEVHFIADKWDLEVVAHELCHALIHRIRVLKPTAEQLVEQDGDSEETICYEFGAWVDEVYKLLFRANTPAKYVKMYGKQEEGDDE